MTILYSELAQVYHEMYQHVFDYDKEFDYYDLILKSNSCSKILEIGCGSGMLARRFIKHDYDYLGLDLFAEMLEIARSETGSDRFIRCDMRNLQFDGQFDAVLITGRSLAYVEENKGILDTLKGIRTSLKADGILVFDVFEANGIFDNFGDFEQTIEHNGTTIKRVSSLKMNLSTGWTYDWSAKYIITKEAVTKEYEDLTTLRAFTKDEMVLFLKLAGYTTLKMENEGKVITVIARKETV